ncbi:hypothetical protein SBRCBS47491_004509 [Sporothrix bragantina]|uniref:Major facilitator superfamily (MFS) profile domain-containing protein n=1 Tax=Sporothrix bragantina TaxID=671064 RepID=A0ABP0BQI1_9PEZI
MASTPSEKSPPAHIDHVDTPTKDITPNEDINEQIVQHLMTTGQEVGMTWHSVFAVISMMMCYNAYVFTLVIPPAILSYINTDLGPDPSYTWITVSWNLGGAIFVTIAGRLSDMFGRRYFMVAGSVLLICGSIICATGQSIGQMIAGGAIFGAGSGLLEIVFGAVQEVVPNKYRSIFVGLFDASSVIAQIMPLVSWAIILHTNNWRNCYYVMIGFQTLNLAFLLFFYHPPSFADKKDEHGKSPRQLLAAFDWLGLFLFVAGCTLFIVGLSWGGTTHPWTSAATLAPIIVGFVTLVALGFYEAHANLKEPLFPPRLFKSIRQFTVPIIVMAVGGMQYYSSATLWTRMSQLLYANGAISKGLYAEVIPLGSIVGGVFIVFSKRIGHQRWQVFGAVAVQTMCIGIMSTSSIDNPAKSIVLSFFISLCTTINLLNCMVLIGFGIIYQEDLGTAAGLAGTSRLLAGAVAVAIFSNVTNGKYAESLPGAVAANLAPFDLSADIVKQLTAAAKLGTAAAFSAIPGVTPAIKAAAVLGNKQAYLKGAHLSYEVALAFGLCGCIAALFIPSVDVRKWTAQTVAVQQADRKALEEKAANKTVA